MIDEGYIKYRCQWENTPAIEPEWITELTRYRDALHQLNFIGEYPNGVGFGNISVRLESGRLEPGFIITGTQTGHLKTLSAAHYAQVTSFDLKQNSVSCKGLRKASSESLTHGVIYDSDPTTRAIIHVHSPQLWKKLLHQVPTTGKNVPYGTPEMAVETQRLFNQSNLAQAKVFAMAGHDDGIVTFGESLQVAYRVLLECCMAHKFMTPEAAIAATQLPGKPGVL